VTQAAQQTDKPVNLSAPSMTVDEARKVMWLRNNYKPIGELLDEGYLRRSNLEWAAEKAYSARIKQAAQVILDWQGRSTNTVSSHPPQAEETTIDSSTIQLNITIEQARATLWPFKPYRDQPMGLLLDTKQITLQNLAFAVETAYDKQVREAASALLLLQLRQSVEEPDAPAGFVNVVSGGRSFSEGRQMQLMMREGTIMGGFLGAMIVFSIYAFRDSAAIRANAPLTELSYHPLVILGVIIMFALMILGMVLLFYLLDRVINRLDKSVAHHRKGQEGEEHVTRIIQQSLDGEWTLFRNIELPGRNQGDLDSVLIGPPGVWVLEIKNFTGPYRNIGEQWEYMKNNRWSTSKSSPSRQAKNNAVRLGEFLKADGIKQWITPAVVWANPDSPVTIENPAVAVWTLERLRDELGNLWQGKTISEPQRQQIIDKLTKLCEAQVKARELANQNS
jgi:hypothetical protein